MPEDAGGLYSGLKLPGRGGGGTMGIRRRPQADNMSAPPQLQPENTPRPGDSLQTPNDEMVQNQDPAARAVNAGTPPAFDPYLDPIIQKKLIIARDLDNAQAEYIEQGSAHPASRLRNIMATMAGIGTGVLFANPEVGMATRRSINDASMNEARKPIAENIGRLNASSKEYGNISGLAATLSERNAQQREATAAGVNAAAHTRDVTATENKNTYDQEHPEVSTETYTRPGETSPSVNAVPKRSGTGVAPAKLGAAKPDAGQFEVKASADGKSMVQINKATGETKPIALPTGTQLDAQQVSDMQKYVNAALLEDPKLTPTKAMDKYLSESRPNFGLETHAATKAETDTDDSNAESTAASISSAISKLGVKDPTDAYNRFNDTLDKLLARRKDLAKVADKIRAAGKAKYPGAGRKESSSGYKPGDIKAQAEGK